MRRVVTKLWQLQKLPEGTVLKAGNGKRYTVIGSNGIKYLSSGVYGMHSLDYAASTMGPFTVLT